MLYANDVNTNDTANNRWWDPWSGNNWGAGGGWDLYGAGFAPSNGPTYWPSDPGGGAGWPPDINYQMGGVNIGGGRGGGFTSTSPDPTGSDDVASRVRRGLSGALGNSTTLNYTAFPPNQTSYIPPAATPEPAPLAQPTTFSQYSQAPRGEGTGAATSGTGPLQPNIMAPQPLSQGSQLPGRVRPQSYNDGFEPAAKGGVFTKPTKVLLGERGAEAVVPLGGGGTSGIVSPSAFLPGMGTLPRQPRYEGSHPGEIRTPAPLMGGARIGNGPLSGPGQPQKFSNYSRSRI